MTIFDVKDNYPEFYNRLKVEYFMIYCDDCPSYDEVGSIDSLVSDEDVCAEWADTEFTEDDVL